MTSQRKTLAAQYVSRVINAAKLGIRVQESHTRFTGREGVWAANRGDGAVSVDVASFDRDDAMETAGALVRVLGPLFALEMTYEPPDREPQLHYVWFTVRR
ncbi:hypothetical protein [Amycolatopsis orientalis]|uniref:hypothetical protein n=1 Tax=Amycolatopsis orientalis TaxID=31958 RepID=UPI00039BEFFE|nr:hypothetical protein [Amycolatopsis orientalis]